MSIRTDLHEENRISWNAATRAHNAHKRDQVSHLAGGGTTLFPEETALLGDVRGKRVVHLQCNAGQDTLSLCHLNPAQVVGVDISDEAIAFARELSSSSGVSAQFERSDIYDWLASSKGADLDVAFSSYGAIGWLSDLAAWARGVAGVLRPGGRICLVEFHPVLQMYDDAGVRRFPYFGDGQVFTDRGVGDYVAESGEALWPWGFTETEAFENPNRCHGFQWTIADILTSVLDAGLAIDHFAEFPYSNGCRFYPSMRQLPGRRWVMPEGEPNLPMMYALAAHRR